MKVGDRVIRINGNNEGIAEGSKGEVNFLSHRDQFASVTWEDVTPGDKRNTCLHDVNNLLVCNTPVGTYPGECIPAGWLNENVKIQAEDIPEHNVKFVSGLNTKPSNPKDRAATHRLDLTLFPETARVFGAVAMTEGDSKYGGYNYRAAGVNVSTYIAALARHVGKYYDRGEWADAKTGVPHLANAIACIAVLIDGHCKGNIKDDRPPVMGADLYTWAEGLSKQLHEMFPEGPARFTETKDGNTDGSLPDWLTQKS